MSAYQAINETEREGFSCFQRDRIKPVVAQPEVIREPEPLPGETFEAYIDRLYSEGLYAVSGVRA